MPEDPEDKIAAEVLPFGQDSLMNGTFVNDDTFNQTMSETSKMLASFNP